MSTEKQDSLTESEQIAKQVLRGLGFSAEKIPTTSQRSADFDVSGDEPSYLVEVKSRLLDVKLSPPAGQSSGPVTKLIRHDPKVGEWLADSKQQFTAIDPEHERFWFLWCSMDSHLNALTQAERTISVLYGVQEALDIEPPNRTIVVFYATPAAFERFPAIDGAVVVCPGESLITFCPNEASPRFEQVMNSKLVRSFREFAPGPTLPIERAKIVDGYVIPKEKRGLGHETLRHVQEVTGSPYLIFMTGEVEYMNTLKVSATDLLNDQAALHSPSKV